MNELATLIRSEREKNKLSVRALSEISGISHTEIHRIENGERRNPSPENLKKLSEALKISYETLYELAGYATENRYERFIGIENKFNGIILNEFASKGWSPFPKEMLKEKINNRIITYDLILEKDDFKWIFEFKHITRHQAGMDVVSKYLGQVVLFSPNADKISIVIDNPDVFNSFLKIKTTSLNIEFSIILVDLNKFVIVDEHVLNFKES